MPVVEPRQKQTKVEDTCTFFLTWLERSKTTKIRRRRQSLLSQRLNIELQRTFTKK